MKRKPGVLILVVFLVLFKGVSGQDIRVGAKPDLPTIKLGAQTKLRLMLHYPVNQKAVFPTLTDSIGKIEIIGTGETDTIFDKEDVSNATIVKSYTITSFEPGSHSIPEYEFKVGGAGYKTQAQQLMVESVAVDTTKGVYDIKQPIKVSYTFFDWLRDNWLLIILALLGLGLIAALIYYFRKKPQTAPEIKEEMVVIPAHTIALEKLRDLREKNLWQKPDSIKQHHSELSEIIREYLEKRFSINALEQTTDEIFAGLKRSSISKENRETLKNILVLADLVKFAKEKPIAFESEQNLQNAIRFVEETKSEVQRVENKGAR